jgi:hypothetical protein
VVQQLSSSSQHFQLRHQAVLITGSQETHSPWLLPAPCSAQLRK